MLVLAAAFAAPTPPPDVPSGLPEPPPASSLSRFGHALPLAAPGLVADGTLALVRRPSGGRILFAHQDDGALPSLETCLTRALETEPEVRRLLSPT